MKILAAILIMITALYSTSINNIKYNLDRDIDKNSSSITTFSLNELTSIVSDINNINIVLSNKIDKDTRFYIGNDLVNKDYLTILKSVLNQSGFYLVKKSNKLYYIDKKVSNFNDFSYSFKNISFSDIKEVVNMFDLKYFYDKNTNIIFYTCSNEDNIKLKNIFKRVDKNIKTKKLKITIYELNRTNLELYDFTPSINIKNDKFFMDFLMYPFSVSSTTFSSSFIKLALKDLISLDSVKIVNDITISISNNSETIFKTVESYKISSDTIKENDYIVTKDNFRDVGLIIKVFSKFYSNNKVKLKLNFDFSNISSFFDYPLVNNTTFNNFITLKKGRVFVLGEIKKKLISKSKKSSILSKIPIIGSFFTVNKEDIKNKTLYINLEII